MTWQDKAACKGTPPGLMFPERGEDVRAAKRMCHDLCTVRIECLQVALDNHEQFGIWGGTSERERRRLRRDLNGPKRGPTISRDELLGAPVYVRPSGAEQRRRRREREEGERSDAA